MAPSTRSSTNSFSARKRKLDEEADDVGFRKEKLDKEADNAVFTSIVNGLQRVIDHHQGTCKSVLEVLKVDPRTKHTRHYCVVAVPELMERIHSLNFSNRIVFFNSTDNTNSLNCKVLVPMVDSPVGALPLAFFITSSRSACLMRRMFRALHEVFPENAFNKRSAVKVVITGTENSERISVIKSFPTIRTYIGTFHLLRDIWKFLWDPENSIDLNDRTNLFKLFEDIVSSPDEDSLVQNIKLCTENKAYKKYPTFQEYFSELLEKKESWGLEFRIRKYVSYDRNVLISEKRVLKEDILSQFKGCNQTKLFEFLCTTFCDYYKQKILDATDGSIDSLKELRYMPRQENEVDDLKVAAVYFNEVLVVNTEKKHEFYVNKDLGICSCKRGRYGSPCIHQYVVSAKYDSCLFRIAPMSEDQKYQYNYFAGGCYSMENRNGRIENIDVSNKLVHCVTKEEEVTVLQNPLKVEDIPIQEVEQTHSQQNGLQANRRQRSVEECVQAIEIFWSKLSDYVNDHTDQIYDWFTDMNERLGRANSFDDVLSTLHADTKT